MRWKTSPVTKDWDVFSLDFIAPNLSNNNSPFWWIHIYTSTGRIQIEVLNSFHDFLQQRHEYLSSTNCTLKSWNRRGVIFCNGEPINLWYKLQFITQWNVSIFNSTYQRETPPATCPWVKCKFVPCWWLEYNPRIGHLSLHTTQYWLLVVFTPLFGELLFHNNCMYMKITYDSEIEF